MTTVVEEKFSASSYSLPQPGDGQLPRRDDHRDPIRRRRQQAAARVSGAGDELAPEFEESVAHA
jgi:hypothetical protein